MTKSELIAQLAARHSQFSVIRGFGSFSLSFRPARLGRNPKSGERVQVPAKYVPHFKAGKELRDRVDFPL
ncbi:MAG: integration host factor subunit beta [Thiobacillus sp. SCN 62-729]|nr:MAG: integration host factor subunit beta [Thiobacillus sp. SCN 62-729]